jgi:ribosomal protein S18 acetylase RimI-like enzyme
MSDHNASGNTGPNASHPVVSKLDEKDLPEAARIVRLAFGTFIGVPDPGMFWADRDYVFGRQQAAHVASFGATLDGKLVGSNFATNWGSVGFFGPLTVRPDLQERGIARALLAKTMEQFDTWDTRHIGLFTFSHSAKHIALYQKYGFYARFLTAIMSAKAVRQTAVGWSRFSALSEMQQEEALQSCRDVAETVYPGLDLSGEIRATHAQGLGDIVLVEGAPGIAAFAVCHYGPRSEAGADTCFIKFGAVREGQLAEYDYLRLLGACEALAVAVGM